MKRTPAGSGFVMPAEWETQDAVWLSWPHDEETFPDLASVKATYLAIVTAITRDEAVHLLVRDADDEREVLRMLAGCPGGVPANLVLHAMDYADVWIRDYGPGFIVNRQEHRLAMIDWTFNAWGNKYPALLEDDLVPGLMNRDLGLEVFSPGIVLEGGSIDVNGRGTVLTTEQCLLNSNRNPGLRKDEIETILSEYLGCRQVVWLKKGIAGDDTDGHIDDVARFVGEHTIVCAREERRDDENYQSLEENYRILSSGRDQLGSPFRVIPLPMPSPFGEPDRLPASYANFLVTNRSVLVPCFHDRNDRNAQAVLSSVFPGRKVVGIDCRALVAGQGAVHCISQQQPRP